MTIAPDFAIDEQMLAEICQRYHVREMSIFGSAARGELRPDSDIDILVEFPPDATPGWDFFRLEEELSQIFGRKVDLGAKASLKPRVRRDALRDARVLYAA
jgi:predicted nucleotidyltransferase